ncbi:MAG: chromosome segregation protein SMC [Chloroflexi bacterium HGW-Chloroflexi-3]|nr:MAG: chromosome segregation protein SMC [Chloroflexi bacterium HGW-Chloroflexi-3]
MISRLRSLELQGYKTFASKTNFEFPGKITAIVGPNGSGKSNIADSIRWVLGEQSYRLLRGRKTEDMIFAGSEGRSRAGMASSTITFNNEDGWLPIDFSEVSVTRRAYRDGQNEYLLNGQRIRLRDIQELLGQSGLAERTYTLIGQGLVDSALSIRPDERRKFFEEAAGIGLYRSRREDSLNRLEQTRHNLERVTDILSELEPRLRSLDRQTKRFLEYKTLQADLQVLLRIWYGYHWNNAQKDLSQSRHVLHEREIHLNNVKNNYEKIEKQFSDIRNQISSKRSTLNELHSQSSTQHLELEKIIRDLAVLDERQRSLHDQEYNQNYDLVRLEEEIKSKELFLENLEAEYQKLTQEVDEAKANLDKAQKSLNERLNIRGQVESVLQKIRRTLFENETKLVEAKAKQNELSERIINLKLSLEKICQEGLDIQKELLEKEKDLEKSKKYLTDSEKSIEIIKKKVLESSTKKHEIDKKLHEKRNFLNKLQSEVIKLNAQYEALIEAEKTLSGFNLGAKNLMNAHRTGKFSGQYQPFSEVLNVPSELEAAIAAALGEFLDSIVLLDNSDPSYAIQYLAKGDQGRAILLPLQWLKNDKEQKLPSINGLVGRASELVKFDHHYRPVVQNLLGKTIIVDNHENAIKALGEFPSHLRFVTLNGEVFQGNGVVFAGKENRSSIIARPRQKQELMRVIEETQERFTILEVEMADLEGEFDTLNDDHNKITQDEQKHYQELQQNQKLVNLRNLDYEKLSQRKQWVENQIKTLEQQLLHSLESEAITKNLLLEIGKKIESQRTESDGLRAKLNEMPIDDFQSNVGHWKTNLAVVDRATNEAQKRLLENRTNIDQNRQRFRSINRRLEDFKNALLEIDDERGVKKAKETELKDEIEKIRQHFIPTENKLKVLEKTFDKLQEEISNAQQTVTIGERYVTQGQLDYSRNKDILENLRRRIEEDFGLVSFEYSSSITGPNPLPFEGLVEQLPIVTEIEPNLEENINRQRAQMRRIGPINPEAEDEYRSVKERFEFLSVQVEDLKKADQDLRQVIAELDELMQREFRKTFDAVAFEFKDLFSRLFGGGSAKLYLTDEENFNNTGIEIEARLPGRREQGLSLLSGGERSLTAVALIFSLLRVSPPPFCVLDEVDAALDEANVGRFCDLLSELGKKIQFIVITHNRNTVQAADVIYGITMGRDSSSQMISLKLDEVSDDLVK